MGKELSSTIRYNDQKFPSEYKPYATFVAQSYKNQTKAFVQQRKTLNWQRQVMDQALLENGIKEKSDVMTYQDTETEYFKLVERGIIAPHEGIKKKIKSDRDTDEDS